MTMKRVLTFCAALLTIGLGGGQAAEVKGKVLDYGIVRLPAGQRTIRTPETPSGVTHIPDSPPTITTTTNRIPARLGLAFGVVFEISNLPATNGEQVEVTIVISHPEATKPDGSVSRGFSQTSKCPVENGTTVLIPSCKFDHEYELAPGIWKFEVRYAGKAMARQEFTVFRE